MSGSTAKVMRVPTKAWFGDDGIDLHFPDSWDVIECRMAGHDAEPLSDEGIRGALRNPLGAEPLQEIARGRKRVAILFDDLTRPTPAWRVIPFVLEELHAVGIEDDQIRFIAAFANHHTMVRHDHVKKIGEEIVERYRVFNHNPFRNLEDLGKTSRGTPVLINREVMSCDLKIAISGLIPHLTAGYGGGAKLILPGVAGIQTVAYNHGHIAGRGPGRTPNPTVGLAKVHGNDVRLDMEEVARMVGLDFSINIVMNNRRQAINIFAGEVVDAHRAGYGFGQGVYTTPVPKDCDIVVTNSYPIENEPGKALWAPNASVKQGGDVVCIVQSPEGHIPHYLVGRFGSDYGGELWFPTKGLRVPKARRIIVFTEYPVKADDEAFGPLDKVVVCKTWAEVLIQLMPANRSDAKVAVFPYAAIQHGPTQS